MKMRPILLLLLFGCICLFLTFNRHSKSGYFNYHSEIWADKAGYYVYLPALFIYDFDASKFPDSMDQKTGNGFFLDRKNNKIFTKYTYGVALFQLPFFIIANIVAPLSGYEKDGFSPPYQKMTDVAAVFYLCLGFLFLFNFLENKFSHGIIYIVFLILFTGTNLYYYSIDETGLSHIYSFFLFSALLYLLKLKNEKKNRNNKLIVWTALTCAAIMAVRPINLVFIVPVFLLDIKSFEEIKLRIKSFFKFKTIFIYAACFALFSLPQLLYYYIISGHFITDTYAGETFNHLADPKILNVWFAPQNGLFLYNPVLIFFMWGLMLMMRHKHFNGYLFLLLFLLVTYTYASWSSWQLGCAYGHRGFVELYAMMSLALGYFIQFVHNKKSKSVKIIYFVIILTLVTYNMKIIYTYDNCWFGKNSWDWSEYRNLVFSKTK